MKNHVIKSRIRFTIFVVIMLIFVGTAFSLLAGTTPVVTGHTETKYQTVEVIDGDTLWDIADMYMPDDMDRREAVYELSQINNLEDTQLEPGQEIKVPVE